MLHLLMATDQNNEQIIERNWRPIYIGVLLYTLLLIVLLSLFSIGA